MQQVIAQSLIAVVGVLAGACTQPQPADLAIRGAAIVDVRSGSLLTDQTVLVKDNRIVAVGSASAVQPSRAAQVLEAEGKYLIPGLWDMHVHSLANVVLEGSGESVEAHDWHFPLFLAWGVTGVRNMNDGTGDVTLELSNAVKRRMATGELTGPPRVLTAGPSLDGDPPLGSNAVVVRTAAEARAAVEQLASNGADLVKVYENLSREAYFAIMEEARRLGIPVDGHVPFRVTPEEAAEAGQRTAEHPEAILAVCSQHTRAERERFARDLGDYDSLSESEQFLIQFRFYRALYDTQDPSACASGLEAYRRNGVAVTADLLVYHGVVHANAILADSNALRLVPPAIRRDWENWFAGETAREFQSILRPIPARELENVRRANAAGVTILAATDVGIPLQVPGISLHEELERLVEAGLTPLEVLRAATLNPAHVLGLGHSLGTVEAGKLADLVLLDGNPLADIRNTQRIRAVVADGRLFRRVDLDRLLAEVEISYAKEKGPL